MKEVKWKVATYLVFALTLALATTLGLGAAPSHAVGACGWNPEASRNAYVDHSNAHLFLIAYKDGCGHRKYQAQIQSTGGYHLSGYVEFRVWVCGNSVDSGFAYYSLYNPGEVGYVWSSTYSYPWYCGAQADNWNTTVQSSDRSSYNASNGTYLNI